MAVVPLHHDLYTHQLLAGPPFGEGRIVMTTASITRPAMTGGPVPPPQRPRRRAPGARLWEASPLTYLALILAIVLSVFPIIWSFIIASRKSDAIYEYPPSFGNLL